jgi:hypothetical protein
MGKVKFSFLPLISPQISKFPWKVKRPQRVSFPHFFLFFFPVLGMEPRALHMLGKCSTTEVQPQPHPPIFYLNRWGLTILPRLAPNSWVQGSSHLSLRSSWHYRTAMAPSSVSLVGGTNLCSEMPDNKQGQDGRLRGSGSSTLPLYTFLSQ